MTRLVRGAVAGAALLLTGCAAATAAPRLEATRPAPVVVPWRSLPPAGDDVPSPIILPSTGGPPPMCTHNASGTGTLTRAADGSLVGRLRIAVAAGDSCDIPSYPTLRILDRVGHVLVTGAGPAPGPPIVEPPGRFGTYVDARHPAGLAVTLRGLGCARPAVALLSVNTQTVRMTLTSPPPPAGCGRPDHATLATGPIGSAARSAPDPPASRAGLRLTLVAPATSAARGPTALRLRVANPTAYDVPLTPCPDVTLATTSPGGGSETFFALNCAQAPATVPAGSEVDFAIDQTLHGRDRATLTIGIAGTRLASTTLQRR